MPKKFMRKVLVSVDVDVPFYHIWVEDLGDSKKTLELAKTSMGADVPTLLDDASVSINASFTECSDEAMDDQAVTEDGGWCHISDLKDAEGNKVEPTSDRRYADPDYEKSAWYREELEKAGQQSLPGLEKKDETPD